MIWQAVVIKMYPYTLFNRGYHYILTVIDVLSKHAWVEPLKTKSKTNEVTKAIAKIIRDDVRKICILTEKRNFTTRMCRNS